MTLFEYALQTVIPYTIGSAFQAIQLPETRHENVLEHDGDPAQEQDRLDTRKDTKTKTLKAA